jgi:hypothetical protein
VTAAPQPPRPPLPVRLFKHPRFQLWLNLIMFTGAIFATIVAPILGLLESVAWVSWLSQVALIYAGLAGVVGALVYMDAKSGMTLNQADRDWIKATIAGEVDDAVEELEAAARADEL